MLRLALLAAVFALGCTTSFDLGQLGLADTGADASVTDVSNDLGDVTVTVDAPTEDVPSADAGPSCGVSGRPCCEVDGGARCGPSLVCSQGACVPCPAGLTACGDLCVDPAVSVAHCGGCGNRCPDGQECQGGSCRLNCPSPLVACGARCALLSTDAANCGACGAACPSTSGTPRCASGACVTDCAAGRGDCDADRANGCETDLSTAVAHCGACGRRCAYANASAGCVAGACRLGDCAAGFADCDGDATNGCEIDTRASTSHCGTCGQACASGQVCRDGVCVTTTVTCDPPSADCNGLASDMCEVDLGTSTSHCGACGRSCAPPNATPRCAAGVCAVASCAAGYGDCDGNAANGCEVNTAASLEHCGACGRRCGRPNASAACANGACALVACNAGYGDCDNNPDNGCETSLQASASHCGGCGVACAPAHATGACVGGACGVMTCDPGWADCDGSAANGCEVDTRTSAAHCGACGRLCALPNARTACANGACAVVACDDGYGDCDGDPANGCEASLSTLAHCGRCGRRCPMPGAPGVQNVASATCDSDECRVACARGYGDCDGDVSNGCETRLDSVTDCGGCGRRCVLAGVPTVACCVPSMTSREVQCCALNCNGGQLAVCAAPQGP